MFCGIAITKLLLLEEIMGYEIDFIGVKNAKAKKDADAIVLRWKENDKYKICVYDGGFKVHGEEMVDHLNKYCFADIDESERVIDAIIVSHPDQDHTSGLIEVLENFKVNALYMNRPWLYTDELDDNKNDGRITEKSLVKRLREKYPFIATLEKIALDRGIKIYEAFQGTVINDRLTILSPSKEFYLDLIIESNKTPLIAESTTNYRAILNSLRAFSNYIKNLIESWTDEKLREDVTTTSENEMSTVIYGDMPTGEGILLTGDAGKRALIEAMDYAETKEIYLDSNVSFYQVPHHGGRHNISSTIMDRMVGDIVEENKSDNRVAFASCSEDSDHPLQMVVNAYVRRGVTVYSNNNGCTIHHSSGKMPERPGWYSLNKIEFNENVEEWDD